MTLIGQINVLLMDNVAIRAMRRKNVDRFDVRPAGIHCRRPRISGGNQQKNCRRARTT
jgi:ABC-type uncharacterized transport system ATPase subunit